MEENEKSYFCLVILDICLYFGYLLRKANKHEFSFRRVQRAVLLTDIRTIKVPESDLPIL